MVCFGPTAATARPPHPHRKPDTSFTHLASFLLESELGVIYGRIQVYPTNEYTPAVHRMLQVSANLHEAARVPADADDAALPSVFRPVFARNGEAIYISGYEAQSGDVALRLTPPLDLDDPADRARLQPRDNAFGVPWIIAAKKGLPNFNELAVENILEISRRLELRRQTPFSFPDETNQMFLVNLSSAVGVEAWNSYSNAFSRPVEIICTNTLDLWLRLTNQPNGNGSVHISRWILGSTQSVTQWPGSGPSALPQSNSFIVPVFTNTTLLSNAVVRSDGTLETNQFPVPGFEREMGFPTLEPSLAVTNRLQFAIVDQETGRVLDYVHLKTGSETNLTQVMANANREEDARLWSLNRRGGADIRMPPDGVLNQIRASLNLGPMNGLDWRDHGFNQAAGLTKEKAISNFRVFCGLSPWYGTPAVPFDGLAMLAPFTPARRIAHVKSWQANDPLVHYNTWELELNPSDSLFELYVALPPQWLKSIGRLNERYEPWGGSPGSTASTGISGVPHHDLRFKDPLVDQPDDWHFPAGEPLTPLTLGRIHRGTPWQTLYLKAETIPGWSRPRPSQDEIRWMRWTGVRHLLPAAEIAPQTDWPLVTHLIQELWPRPPGHLISVNDPHHGHWLKALDGITVQTNITPDETLITQWSPTPQIEVEEMSFCSDQAELIAQDIAANRSAQPAQLFTNVSDIVGTPALSTWSPWLNLSSIQQQRGISDAAYEAIPLQLLPKLRPDSFGGVIHKNGRPHLRFSGLSGATYVIETSTDMIHWRPVAAIEASRGMIECELVPAPGESSRFFRSTLLLHDPRKHPRR